MSETALKMENITKVYPNGVMANHDINFEVMSGEIHALSGENGAGKTTLMKILFGEEKPSQGKIYIRGKEMEIQNPQAALKAGIGMVHQHFMLVPSLSVTENIILGMEPRKKGIVIDRKKAYDDVVAVSRKYDMQLDPEAKVKDLSVGQKQKLEILKVLIRGARIIILDEPTAVLTPQETAELFKQLKVLKEDGFTIIFISHKLNEVREICDRITIIKRGETKGVFRLSEITDDEITERMVGRNIASRRKHEKSVPGDKVLVVDGVSVFDGKSERPVVDDVSFSVREGEILGIAGVEGNGQTDLVNAITGICQFQKGSIHFHDKDLPNGRIREIRELGISHIPEDRMTLGIAPRLSITENIVASVIDDPKFTGKARSMDKKAMDDYGKEMVEKYTVLCSSPDAAINSLSGGNIQKAVLARELGSGPKLIIANQPTRGVDIGACELIQDNLLRMRKEGKAVLLVSSDLNELFNLSDRLMVMYDGKIAACFTDLSGVSDSELGQYMLGIKSMDGETIRRCAYEN